MGLLSRSIVLLACAARSNDASLPVRQRAVVVSAHGGPEVLSSVADWSVPEISVKFQASAAKQGRVDACPARADVLQPPRRMTASSYYPGSVPGSPQPPPPGSPLPPFGGPSSPFAPGGPGVGTFPTGPTAGPNQSFLSLFGNTDLSLQEIADKAHQLQHKIDENAEQEKASLRTAAEQKHLEIERHAAELARHAASSIEAYKTVQLQTAERQKAYQQAVVRQQAEQAKRLIDQQAAQAIGAVETRDRQLSLQRQQQELVQRGAPQYLSALGGPLPGGPPYPGGNMDGIPDALQANMYGGGPMGKTMFAGADRNRDGMPEGFPTMLGGADRNRDGIPDGLQVQPFGSGGPSMAPGGIPSMQTLPPRQGSPMPGGPRGY